MSSYLINGLKPKQLIPPKPLSRRLLATLTDEVTKEDLMKIEVLLNNRPRKVLNFMTPLARISHTHC